jgi:hypothetical protein
MIPIARGQRGPSDSQTSLEGVGRLFFTARIGRAHSYRARSASKKNGLPTPSNPSETARCANWQLDLFDRFVNQCAVGFCFERQRSLTFCRIT